MTDWLYHFPVVWMTAAVFALTFLVTGLIYISVQAFAARGHTGTFKAMSPVTLTPLAVVFALLVGFLSAQVWSDSDRANAAVTREASALRTVLICAGHVPKEPAARMRALVRHHIQEAVIREWPAMGGPPSDAGDGHCFGYGSAQRVG